jgi:hypothetical protein
MDCLVAREAISAALDDEPIGVDFTQKDPAPQPTGPVH